MMKLIGRPGAWKHGTPVLSAAIMVLAMAAPMVAQELSLRCDMPRAREKYGHSKVYFVGHKPGSDVVVLSDEWTLAYMKGPVAAKVKFNNDKRLTFKWNVEGLGDTNAAHAEKLRFTGTYLRKTGILDVQVRLSGYDPFPGVRGKCKRVKK